MGHAHALWDEADSTPLRQGVEGKLLAEVTLAPIRKGQQQQPCWDIPCTTSLPVDVERPSVSSKSSCAQRPPGCAGAAYGAGTA